MKKSVKLCAFLVALTSSFAACALTGCVDILIPESSSSTLSEESTFESSLNSVEESSSVSSVEQSSDSSVDSSSEESSSGPVIEDNRTLTLDKTELSLIRGTTYTLTATLSLGKGEFTWSSSDESVATVSKDGVVTAVALGNATITVAYDDKVATCAVTVVLPDYEPEFAEKEQELTLATGSSFAINDEVLFNGESVECTVSYESVNEEIATVDESGLVTGVRVGETYITVTANYEGRVTTMQVKVTVQANVVIESSAASLSLATFSVPNTTFTDSENLYVRVLKDGVDVSDSLTIAWTIDDETVLSKSGEGNSVGVTAKKAGSTGVTASFTLDEKTYEYTFNVTVATTSLTVEPVDGRLNVDLTGAAGEITSVAIDSADVTSFVTEGILSVGKKTLDAGEHTVVVNTANGEQTFLLNVDKELVSLADEKKTAENNAYTVDMSAANIDWDNVMEFTVNGSDGNSLREGNMLSLPQASTPYGHYEVSIVTKGKTDYRFDLFCYTTSLNTTTVKSAADLLLLLQGAPSASFTLEEDLDFGNVAFEGYVSNFSGTLDGQGHTIKNFKIVPTTLLNEQGSDLTAVYFIQNNSGTIKNIAFDYELAKIQDCNLSSLIGKNTGTVDNCYVKFHFTSSVKSWNIAPLVNDNYGTVKNCIIVLTKQTGAATNPGGVADDVAPSKHFGSVVSITREKSTLTNCYAVYNDVLSGADAQNPYQYGGLVAGATVAGCQNYETLQELFAAVTEFPVDDGWSMYWKVENGSVLFGSFALDAPEEVSMKVNVTGFRYGRAIYVSATTPRLDVNLTVDKDLTGVTDTLPVTVNGKLVNVSFTYYAAGSYIEFMIENPNGWTPVAGSDNYASDPAVDFILTIPAGTKLGEYELQANVSYKISKPAGLDASTAHPRVDCTGEVFEGTYVPPEEPPVEPQVEYVNVTGYRYGRAIYVSATTPRLDVEFFVDRVFEDKNNTGVVPYVVAENVLVYVNGTEYRVTMNYNSATSALTFSVENPNGWTPVAGSDNYASDPAVDFILTIPAGTKLGEYELQANVSYKISKPAGLDASTAHPRVDCTGEVFE